LAAAAAEAAEFAAGASQEGAAATTPASRQHAVVSLVSLQHTQEQRANVTGLRRRCTFRLTATLPPPAPSEAWHGRPSVRLQGLLESSECGISLRLNASLLHTEALVVKASNAALLASMTALALLSVTVRQMEASASGSAMTRVSLACICHQSTLDSYACLLHLTGGLMVDALFSSFLTTAMCFFVLFSFFEVRVALASSWL
jgi:hypothetical protein